MRVYATAQDYYDFIGKEQPMVTPQPDTGPEPVEDKELDALLRRASIRIESYTRTSRYSTDEDGYPTDPKVTEAFMLATCAQATWFMETEDVTGADSQSGMVKIGSVQLGGASADANGPKDTEKARLSPEAVEILMNARLLIGFVGHS
ncbi:MAG: hypothetical protein WBA28_00490 [Microbacteriaceae bacterium]